jgi:hypothetical protein
VPRATFALPLQVGGFRLRFHPDDDDDDDGDGALI